MKNLFVLAGATLIVGTAAGLYPAFYLTRFEPARVLKEGPQPGRGRSLFRRNMVVIQFSISIMLIIGVFTVYKQMRYIQTRSLGFDKENVVILPVRSEQIAQNYGAFRNELMQNAQILSASASSEVPADSHYSNSYVNRPNSEEAINLTFFTCDYDYVGTYRMELLAGRAFSREFGTDVEGTIILNESAARRIGWTPEESVGQKLEGVYEGKTSTAELKTKEIGIRKVLGASTGHVIILMSKEFVKWILLANILAWPLAWLMMNRWLQNFAYSTQIGMIVFISAGFAALAVAALTFIFQTVKTACAKPVNSIRSE